jgi:polysaccharide biosynthesis transport protein
MAMKHGSRGEYIGFQALESVPRAAHRRAVAPRAHVAHARSEHTQIDADVINLREILQVLSRRKWIVLGFLVLAVAAATGLTTMKTHLYRATAIIQIDREAPKVLDYQGVLPVVSATERDFYDTQYELLRSRTLAERVIRDLSLAANPQFGAGAAARPLLIRLSEWMPQAWASSMPAPKDPSAGGPDLVSQFLSALSIEPVRNSWLVRIHFVSASPELATAAANAIASAYVSLNLERRFDATSYARGYLQERLQQVKQRLEDSEREMVGFARREGIVSVDERRTVNSQNLAELSSALARVEQERIAAQAALRQMQETPGAVSTRVLQQPVISELKQTVARLESEYQENMRLFKPAYPRMQQLRGQIEELEARIGAEVEQTRLALAADYATARQQEALLKTRVAETTEELLSLQSRSIQYNMLNREVDTSRQLFDALLQRFNELSVGAGVTANNVSVVDPAELPRQAHSPSWKKNLLLAAILSLLGGVALAFLREHFDDTVRTPQDLERLGGMPVLGVVPRAGGRRMLAARRPLALASEHDPRSPLAEAYRCARMALQFSTVEGAPKVLLVTSPAVGEGKSTTAANLAVHFARAGKRTLLIDADLRCPSLSRLFGMDDRPGLADYLAGDARLAEIAGATLVSDLWLMPAGAAAPDPAQLLAGERMAALLARAAEQFDCVILDGPPTLGVADAIVLGHLAEGTILVAQAGGTRGPHVQAALKVLQAARSRVLGGVLTRCRGEAEAVYRSSYR